MKCWICGDKATTKEHKIKGSVIKSLMAKDLDEKLQHFIRDNIHPKNRRHIQSSKSVHLKYNMKNLCAYCNNTRTQPYDFALEEFYKKYLYDENKILKSKVINLSSFTRIERQNLFRLFIKKFGCEINSIPGIIIPKILIDAMHGKEYDKSLALFFVIDKLDKYNSPTFKCIAHQTDVHYESYLNKQTGLNEIREAYFSETYGNLTTIYHYSESETKQTLTAYGKKHAWFGKTKKIFVLINT